MIGRIAVALVLLIVSAPVSGWPTPRAGQSPATQPATQPSAARVTVTSASPATSPTTAPSLAAAAVGKFPTPAELYEKMKRAAETKKALLKVAYFDFDKPVLEGPAEFSLFGAEDGATLHSIIDRMRRAKDDKQVRAVLVTLGAESAMNLAQAQEVRDALADVKRAGKRVFVYADTYDTIGYTVASAASDVCLLGGGEIMIPGIGLETMFFKGTMDKVGVHADYIQIGEFKGAEEPYTRTEPSEELRGEMTRLTEALYEQIVDGVSLARGVSRDAVRQLIDDTMVTAQAAKDRGFVDHLCDQDALRELITEELAGDIDVVHGYGKAKRQELDFSNPFALLASINRKPEPTDKPTIAVIYAQGVIVDGSGEAGLFGGGGVGADPMRRNFRQAIRDENVKAVVLRIDSPGGSALASEVIWQGARRLAAKKPLVVSIGGMAASGGYYLASCGDHIFADPSGIVGSIGVVGGKFVMKDLYEKLGLTTEQFVKGRNAGLFSSNQPWSERQRRMIRTWMQQTYDQFTERVMATRSGKIKDIDKVARGRIFLAKDAKDLGMVDEIGGTDAAIQYAAAKAGLAPGGYDVRPLPAPRTLADLIYGNGGDDDEEFNAASPIDALLRINVSPDSVFHMLPLEMRRTVAQQVRMMQLFEQRPVVLMSPFVVRVR
jgi:protease-4